MKTKSQWAFALILAVVMLFSLPKTEFLAEKTITSADGNWMLVVYDNGETSAALYYGSEEKVVIPSVIDGYTITEIGQFAFKDKTFVTEVTLPATAKKIGYGTFRNCSNLEKVVLPEGLTFIDMYAFDNCKKLTTLEFPSTLEEIGKNALYNCQSLTTIHIPKSLTTADVNVFKGCTSLTEVTWEEGITQIPQKLFAYASGITEITIPNGVTEIGTQAFAGCDSLQTVVIPDTVKTIKTNAFYECKALTTVTMSKKLETLGDTVFSSCEKLTGIFIPKTLKTVGYFCFSGCNSMEDVVLEDGLKVIPFGLFSGCNGLRTIEIPDSVTTIEGTAFINCEKLESIYLSDYVTSLGHQVFAGCISLTDVRLGRGIKTIPAHAFESCYSLKKLTVPYTVKKIEEDALVSTGLLELYLPSSVKSIDDIAIIDVLKNIIIYGRPDSHAESYAKNKGYTFQELVIPATYLSIDKTTMTLNKGASQTIGFYLDPINTLDDMIWSSSDESVATVTDEGVVTAHKAGKAEITFTVGDLSQTCVVTVVQPVETITLDSTKVRIQLDKNQKLVAKVLPSDANNKKLKWETSNSKVVTVDQNGVITAVGYGSATVSATSTDGSNVKVKCTVIVPYKLTYKLNGGTNNSSNPSDYYKESITLKSPTRKGYTFVGWYTDSSYKNEITKITTSTTGSKTLYAKWSANKYNIKFDGNGATEGKMSTLTNRQYGKSYTLTANAFKKKGYTFTGWNTKEDGKGTSYANKATVKSMTTTDGKTITLYAQWKVNKYTIKFSGNGATSGKMSSLTSRQYDKTYKLTSNAFKRKGYTFTGWNTKADGSGKKYADKASVKNLTSSNGNTVTLYAQWKKQKYTITYVLNNGKNNKSNPSSYTVTTSTIKLAKPTRSGYTFVGWYSDSKYKNKVTQIKKGSTGNVKLYAKWKKK